MNPPVATSSPAFPYSDTQWIARQQFIDHIDTICKQEGISVEWLSHFWIARLSRSGRHKYITGYSFPVNAADAVAIARDKVATYEVLTNAGIPAVPHWALHFPPAPSTAANIERLANYALELHPLPLVVKPIAGSTGLDVCRAQTQAELSQHLNQLSIHYHTAAASPLITDAEEYRVIMLNQKAEIIFRKVRPNSPTGRTEWRHNLALGSTPDPVTDATLSRRLTNLAKQTMLELGLTLAAVDIIGSTSGLQIIEVNTGFTTHHLSLDPRFQAPVANLLSAAVKLSVAASPT